MLQCTIGQTGVICEGMNDNGCCGVYSDEGVAARNFRIRICDFQEIRKPIVVVKAKKRVGQQKQTKKNVKSGTVAVVEQ